METDPPIPADEPRASAPRDEWETSSGARRRFRFGWVIVSALIVVAGTLLLLRDHTPELTRELLDRAHTVWLEQGIEDYRLRFIKRVDRQEEERFDVVVEGGVVTTVSSNGRALAPADKSAYGVEGLFDTMRGELELASETRPDEGARSRAVLRALFDERTGAPLVLKVLAGSGRSFDLRVVALALEDGRNIVGAP
ncbi:MAG TPA: hypothetical protein VK116_19750 [Planctomycetota bacterium]|nr:hypothetical protein [Planctomycetota bacterium]